MIPTLRFRGKRYSELNWIEGHLQYDSGDVWINGYYVQEVEQLFFDAKTKEESWIKVNITY